MLLPFAALMNSSVRSAVTWVQNCCTRCVFRLWLSSSRKHTCVMGSRFFASTFCRCWTFKSSTGVIGPDNAILSSFTCEQQLKIWSMSFSMLDHKADRKAGLLPVTGIDTRPGPLNLVSFPWRLLELLLVDNCDSCSMLSAFRRLVRKLFLAFSNTDSTVDSKIPRLWNTCRAVPT